MQTEIVFSDGFYDHGHEPSGSVRVGHLLNIEITIDCSKKNPVLWTWLRTSVVMPL